MPLTQIEIDFMRSLMSSLREIAEESKLQREVLTNILHKLESEDRK